MFFSNRLFRVQPIVPVRSAYAYSG